MLEGEGKELRSKAKPNRFAFEGGHWKLAYADEPLTSTRFTNFRTVEVTNFAIQLGMMVERFWRLTFLPSLRLLVASHLAFKICFLAPCLWWESENTHVYF